jgi:hypothetical protein
MKRFALLMVVFLAATAPLAAQGPGRAALSATPVPVSVLRANAAPVVPRSGMTRSERGALIGAIIGLVAGGILSASYDEKSVGSVLTAGIVMAIPVSLIGAIIGSM